MNRNRYRLVFRGAVGMWTPVAETARSHGKTASGALLATVLLLAAAAPDAAWAELPVPSAGGAIPGFVGHGQASFQVNGAQAFVNQVGNKAILNWQNFNISAGHNVQFRQVDSLAANNPVAGANFTSLNRIWDANPSVIAGSISQAAGQRANVIMVNSNGIAFMGGSQVNLNQFTASTLNLADRFVLDSFLTTNTLTPQFEKTLDDAEGRGFVKVLEGARISAGSQGRVMLIAPTVVNRGVVEAPDGQVIAAAGNKVYLRSASGQDANVRGLLVEVDSAASLSDFDTANGSVADGVLDGQTVALADAALDKLGHATNVGSLSAARGNVTMIGYAVNQQGIASATTSVLANGSVYLLAKDRAQNNSQSSRGGRATLGSASLTEVLPEIGDTTGAVDGSAGARLDAPSRVSVLGQDIRMASGALIDAPAGNVSLVAQDDPGADSSSNPFTNPGANLISGTARVHLEGGARINVAGLDKVRVSAARNSVEVELRADELKDSPVNRTGPLYQQKVYVDVNRALANADAGKSTLIARDSLENYQGQQQRTVAERSTVGGTVTIQSQGLTVLQDGSSIDLSGGSVHYDAANVRTSVVVSGGVQTDLTDARPDIPYEGISTRYVIDYGRWNRKEVIDLGQSFRFDPGYVDGKDAGQLSVIGLQATVMQADVHGRTTTGELQREAGTQPLGARLVIGTGAVAGDYKLNQRIALAAASTVLPGSFGFGDTLPGGFADTLELDTGLIGKDRIARLEMFSNKAAEVRDAVRAPQGGSIAMTAKGVAVRADMQAPAGAISLASRANLVDLDNAPLDVVVSDGVALSARGAWANDLAGTLGQSADAALVNAGTIALRAQEDLVLGQGTLLNVDGGARVKPDGGLKNGNGGNLTLEAGLLMELGSTLQGYGLGKGGSLAISADLVRIGGPADISLLRLDPTLFETGGFANFTISGLTSLEIADGTLLRPTVISRELLPGYTLQPTGGTLDGVSRLIRQDDRLRQAANLSFTAPGPVDPTQGRIRLEEGAQILADNKATVSFSARNRVELLGEVRAHGGSIVAQVNRTENDVFDAAAAVWLGAQGTLDVSGIGATYRDSRGLTQGEVLAAGSVTLAGQGAYVVTQAGSQIKLAGAGPVQLDVPNEAGGLGRAVGSDAGALAITTTEGALLDGTLSAGANAARSRGGVFSFTMAGGDAGARAANGWPVNERALSLAPGVSAQAGGLAPGFPVADSFNGNVRLGVNPLEDAGFDRLRFDTRDAIRFENGVDVGTRHTTPVLSGRTTPLRGLEFNSARFETTGGDARLEAHSVRFSNNLLATPLGGSVGTGQLTVDATQVELAGDLTFDVTGKAKFSGRESVLFSGRSNTDRAGTLRSTADLELVADVVAPATSVAYAISAPGRTVTFGRNADTPETPAMPLSAYGSLSVDASDIEQNGNVWAPFGQLDFQADNRLVFAAGSLTSVASSGDLLPFGTVENGRKWVYGADRSEVADLGRKFIRTDAASIDMQSGARLVVAGGGDVQAYEFTVGPGGSRDILADRNTYAILPGYQGSFAPGDAQEAFDRPSGESVYLSGVPDLKDGVYTLLPGHYALLPGALAVRLNTGVKDLLPGQAYVRQDGVQVAAGHLTDRNSADAPRDANWQGIEVLTREQVLARSEMALVHGSEFFAQSRNRPADAGLLSVNIAGAGSDSLKLDGTFMLAAGAGGRGALVDISAPELLLVSGPQGGPGGNATRLEVDQLNALGAQSLLIGGTRLVSGDTTALTVGANTVTLANDAGHALAAAEVILAARDTLTLQPGSAIDAQGASGDAGLYTTVGNGALVRAASTGARFERSGSPDRSLGTLAGDAASVVRAADSITLDATRQNDFKGQAEFVRNGLAVAGNLAVGATRINFGSAPDGADGITYSESALDAFSSLKSLALTSYSTFDVYGPVSVGGVDADGSPTLQSLRLQGAGIAGLDNAGQTARVRARELVLANPAAVAFAAGGTPGSGTLEVLADALTLGAGDKALAGFSQVAIQAPDVVGEGTGATSVDADTTVTTTRLRGAAGSAQSLRVAGPLAVRNTAAAQLPAATDALGAQWTLTGEGLEFGTLAALPSGVLRLDSGSGDLLLTPDAHIDVAGRVVRFFDVARPSWAGTAELHSGTGNIVAQPGARLDVSAAPGGDAGTVRLSAPAGTVSLAPGSLLGAAQTDSQGARGDGARLVIDAGSVANLSQLLDVVEASGIDGAIHVRARTGPLALGESDRVQAQDVQLVADAGQVEIVGGQIVADGAQGGRIAVFGADRLTVAGTSGISARALADGKDGGSVLLGSATGDVVLAGGSIDTAGAGSGADGTVSVRASRLDGAGMSPLHVPIADTGTANNYAVPLSGITASTLLRGQVVSFTPRFSNTGTSRLNLNGSGAKDIFFNGVALTANRIVANQPVHAVYDGTRFHIVDAAFADRTAPPVLASATVTGTTTTNYTATVGGLTSYRAGTTLLYTPPVDNVGTTNRIDVNGLGAKDIRYNNVALPARFLKAGEPVPLVYDGTNFAVAMEANTPRSTGSGTAFTVAARAAPTAGSVLAFTAHANNAAGAVTLSVNGIAAPLLRNGAALTSGAFRANDVVYATFDGSNYHVLPELAAKVDVGSGVRVTSVAGDYQQPILTRIDGASRIEVEATRTAAPLPIAGGAGVLDANRLSADTYRYLPAAERAGTKSVLAGASPLFDADKLHLVPGTVQASSGDILVPRDMNLADYRFGGEPGVLTVRAEGNLLVNNLLSDGFNVATALNGTVPATLAADRSWAYRLVAGADLTGANPLAVQPGADGVNDVVIAAGKFIRSGTGAIDIASGNDVRLGDDKSAVYSAGRRAEALTGFTNPANAQFSSGGGDVSLSALGDIRSLSRSQQLYSNWLFRQGRLSTDGASYSARPAWWVRFDQFQQGVAALGGGDVTLVAGGEIRNLSASAPTQGRMASATPVVDGLVKTGGGNVRVDAGGDLLGGQYYSDNGQIAIRSGGALGTGDLVGTGANARALYPILALGDAQADVQARGELNIHAVLNPHLVVQSSGSGATSNINNAASPLWSIFSTYSTDSAVNLSSLSGAVNFHNAPGGSDALASMTAASGAYRAPLSFTISAANYLASRAFGVLPASMELLSFQGDTLFGGVQSIMVPAERGNLTLLAHGSVRLPVALTLSDMAPLPDPVLPAISTTGLAATTLTAHALQPVHAGDPEPVRVYAHSGDITGSQNRLNLVSAKAVWAKAGRDISDLGLSVQHMDPDDVSLVEAGRDVLFSTGASRAAASRIWVAGPGRLEVTAGRNLDLGVSAGIVSRGNLDNPALSAVGADIHLAAGVGANGVDYAGAVDRLLGLLTADPSDATTLSLARWLVANPSLTESEAIASVTAVRAQGGETQRARVRDMVFTALRETGRESNNPDSPFAGDFSRGYAALELVFPGVGEKTPEGAFANYRGFVNLFASRVLTEAGGSIEFLVPGGDITVGLANTPAGLLATQTPGAGIGLTDSGVLGMAVIASGDIKGFARGDMLVNQSRILTVGGGDVLLWSSEGDIDAGKGKKTAAVVPPPLILVDSQGNVTQVLQGAATGSGIGALSTGGTPAGDVDLIAPRGTVNAGDAGIRAGNLNIAAQVVLGADNISVSGSTTGAPVADTSAVTAAASGATGGVDEAARTTAALAQSAAESAKVAQQALPEAFRPSIVRVDVLGFGE